MKFRIRKASGGECEEKREINTVEDISKSWRKSIRQRQEFRRIWLCCLTDRGGGADKERDGSGGMEMNIKQAVRILVKNKSTIIWENEETQKQAMLFNAAIDTVAEQFTPVEIEIEGGGTTWWYVCEDCHGAVDKSDMYCRHCGRPLKN